MRRSIDSLFSYLPLLRSHHWRRRSSRLSSIMQKYSLKPIPATKNHNFEQGKCLATQKEGRRKRREGRVKRGECRVQRGERRGSRPVLRRKSRPVQYCAGRAVQYCAAQAAFKRKRRPREERPSRERGAYAQGQGKEEERGKKERGRRRKERASPVQYPDFVIASPKIHQ